MVKHPRPLKVDPTRTSGIRRRFEAEMKRRINRIKKAIYELIVKDDAFGLKQKNPLKFNNVVQNTPNQFLFLSDPNKIKGFRKWLNEQTKAGLLNVQKSNVPWVPDYVESSYKKGVTRAYIDTHSVELAKSPAWYEGSMEQFLTSTFAAPESLEKIELLYTRVFEELQGFTDTMGQQTSRILADGLANGYHPTKIAREMYKQIDGLTRRRALLIARTEIIRAHAEGQLDSFERLGVEELGLKAEWVTAGDTSVCDECEAAAADGPYTIEAARGMIPLHPRCRCCWVPISTK